METPLPITTEKNNQKESKGIVFFWNELFNYDQCKQLGVFPRSRVDKYSTNSPMATILENWQTEHLKKNGCQDQQIRIALENLSDVIVDKLPVKSSENKPTNIFTSEKAQSKLKVSKGDRKEYFKKLNQERKEYNAQKQRESRLRLKNKKCADISKCADIKNVGMFFPKKDIGIKKGTNLLFFVLFNNPPQTYSNTNNNLSFYQDLNNYLPKDETNTFTTQLKKDRHLLSRNTREWIGDRKNNLKRINFVELEKDQSVLSDGKIKPFIMFATENQTTKTLKWNQLIYSDYDFLERVKQWRMNPNNQDQIEWLNKIGTHTMTEYNKHLLFAYLFNKQSTKLTYLRPLYFDKEVRWIEFLAKYYAPKPYELVLTCRDPNFETDKYCQQANCKGDGKNPHKHWDKRTQSWVFNWTKQTFESRGITDLVNEGEYFGINCKYRPHFDFDKPKRKNFESEEDYLKSVEEWNKVVMPMTDFIVDKLKMTHLVKSRSDGRHLPIRVSRNVSQGKLKELWDVMINTFKKLSPTSLQLGDPKGLSGENSFLVSGLCEGYEVLRTKHFNYKDETKNTPIHFWTDEDVDKFKNKLKKRIQRLFLRNLNVKTVRTPWIKKKDNKKPVKSVINPPLLPNKPKQINSADQRTDVVAELVNIKENYLCLKGENTQGDFAWKVKLKVEGEQADYFINVHHRKRFVEKLKTIPPNKELQITILKGKVLNWIDKIKFT